MYWNHSFQYWWLIPVLLILLCFVMCCVVRRRGTLGCCMGARSWRDGWRDRSTDGAENRHLTTSSVEDTAQTENLKMAIRDLEHRIRSLEDRQRGKELRQDAPPSRS